MPYSHFRWRSPSLGNDDSGDEWMELGAVQPAEENSQSGERSKVGQCAEKPMVLGEEVGSRHGFLCGAVRWQL